MMFNIKRNMEIYCYLLWYNRFIEYTVQCEYKKGLIIVKSGMVYH